jgi:NO-binding membrane sensor protein with MHYT domain
MTLTPSQEQFDNLVNISTLIAGASTFIAIALRTRNTRAFANIWGAALGGAGVVTGLAILACAFFKSLIPVLVDLRLYLGITGLSLVYLSIISIYDAWMSTPTQSKPKPPPPNSARPQEPTASEK